MKPTHSPPPAPRTSTLPCCVAAPGWRCADHRQAVCSPSRNSFMSGRRPDVTQVWNFLVSFRDLPAGKQWSTLPSWFLKHNYLTLGTGKLYHEGMPVNGDGTNSWSDLPIQFDCVDSGGKGAGTYCDPTMIGCKTIGTATAPHPRWSAFVVFLRYLSLEREWG